MLFIFRTVVSKFATRSRLARDLGAVLRANHALAQASSWLAATGARRVPRLARRQVPSVRVQKNRGRAQELGLPRCWPTSSAGPGCGGLSRLAPSPWSVAATRTGCRPRATTVHCAACADTRHEYVAPPETKHSSLLITVLWPYCGHGRHRGRSNYAHCFALFAAGSPASAPAASACKPCSSRQIQPWARARSTTAGGGSAARPCSPWQPSGPGAARTPKASEHRKTRMSMHAARCKGWLAPVSVRSTLESGLLG